MLEDFANQVSQEPGNRANQALANGCIVCLFLVPMAAAILVLATIYAQNWLEPTPEPITINVYVQKPEQAPPIVKELTEKTLPQLEDYRMKRRER